MVTAQKLANVGFVTSKLPAETFTVRQFDGAESISQLYKLEVIVDSARGEPLEDAALDELLTATGYIALDRDETQKIHGVVRRVDMLSMLEANAVAYRIQFVPRLWYLTQSVTTRIFQNLSVPEIIKQVLISYGFKETDDFVFRLTSPHPPREYTVQYEESDFAFLARLAEHEGISFHFVHGDAHETVVFGDANGVFVELSGHEVLTYTPNGAGASPSAVHTLERLRTSVPTKVRVRDYNYRTPSLALDATKDVPGPGHGVHVTYGEHVKDTRDTARIAEIRAQEIACKRWVVRGESPLLGLHAGHKFQLSEHFIPGLDGQYLVTSLRHAGAAVEGYHCEFDAIPFAVPFRPERLTAKPRIYGVVHARVDGVDTGTPAPIDDLGRYNITLMADVGAASGGKASRRIRMAQLTSGAGFGVHFPLHIGAEVLLAHIDGDPDRPVIVASVADAGTVSPVTSKNPTQAVIRTRQQIEIHLDDDAKGAFRQGNGTQS